MENLGINNQPVWMLSLGKRRKKNGVIVKKTILTIDLKGITQMRLRVPVDQVNRRIDIFRDLVVEASLKFPDAVVDYFDLPDGYKDDSITVTFDITKVTEAVKLALIIQNSLEKSFDKLSTYGKIGIATGDVADVENQDGGSDLMGILFYFSCSIGKLAKGSCVMVDEETFNKCNWSEIEAGYISDKLTAYNVPRIEHPLNCYEISFNKNAQGLQEGYIR